MEEGWECVEGCAVLELGQQSGVKKSGGRNGKRKGGIWASGGQPNTVQGPIEASQGTAARFFMQFGEDNLIEPVQEEASVRIIQGDCVEEMRAMPENSVDSVVCDPPYGLEFMGKEWDKLEPARNKQRWAGTERDLIKTPDGTPFRRHTGTPTFRPQRNAKCRKCNHYRFGRTPCECTEPDWDHRANEHSQHMQAWHEAWAREALRVLKPGGYLLAFGGTRTVHRLTCAIEDAGFEIRDRYLNIGGDATESIPGEIAWVYGSGFPKSANIEKLMTKAQGQKRRAHGMVPLAGPQSAQMHAGIGSSVKPAYEPVVVARKPLSEKNLVQNILKHGEWLEDGTVYKVGTGGLQIDVSRVGVAANEPNKRRATGENGGADSVFGVGNHKRPETLASGRFPSNTLWSHVPGPNGCQRVGSRRVKGEKNRGLTDTPARSWKNTSTAGINRAGPADPDGLEEVAAWECQPQCPVKALDEQSGVSKRNGGTYTRKGGLGDNFMDDGWTPPETVTTKDYAGEGGASRFFSQFHEPGFFYSPKSSRAERNRGLEGMPLQKNGQQYGTIQNTPNPPHQNAHPTVKPRKLLEYLVGLVSAPGSTCLDPFMGSGTTGIACVSKGVNFVGIEQDESYVAIAERRIQYELTEAQSQTAPSRPDDKLSPPACDKTSTAQASFLFD